MEFRLLGPLEVLDGDRALDLRGRKQRALLAFLLLHANEVVSIDRLIEELWGEEPPQAAATALHGHVSRLRKLLRSDQLVTRQPGYVLQLEPGQLDLDVVERLRDEAHEARSRGDMTDAAARLRDALALWRGPALADVAYEQFAQLEAGRLEDLRLAIVEERTEIDLELGRHAELVPELERLVGEHPLREGFRAQLMLALYRSGRQAEALQVYQEGRGVLVDELGIEPSQRLRDLEQAILRQDDSLTAPDPTAAEAGEEQGAEPVRRLSSRRTLILITAFCALAAAVAAGLLLSHVGGGTASTFRPGTALVDAKTKKLIASVPPSVLAQPASAVYANGHIWLLNVSPGSFVELDPATGQVVDEIKAPDGVGDARAVRPFAVGRDALWVGAGDDVVKLNPRLRTPVDSIKLDKRTGQKGMVEGVALGGGLLWVGRDAGAGQVVVIDPRTHQVVYTFSVTHDADLAFDHGVVWAADSAGVDVIDWATKTVTPVREIESLDPYYGTQSVSTGVAAGGGFGWTTDPAKGLVYQIGRNGTVVTRYKTGLGATGPFFRDGALWVANEDVGTVSRIDPLTDTQSVYRLRHGVAAVAAARNVLLAALEPGPTPEARIAALPGKVLRLFSKEGALGLGNEPALDWDSAAHQVFFATCANLLRHGDEAPPEGLKLRPEVAARMPTLSRDRRTYTFTIRPGYRFAPGGQPLTAETFRDSIERAASPRIVVDPNLTPGAGGDVTDIEGMADFRSGRAREVSGLIAADDKLSITLTKPSPDFLERISNTAFCPVPRGTPYVHGGANLPLDLNAYTIPSAGPYYVADWRNNKYVILKRNPFYHGPRPHRLDAIALREGVDVSIALDRVRHGGWDGIVSSGHMSTNFTDPTLDPDKAVAQRYGDAPAGRIKYVAATLPHTTWIALNAVTGPLADPRVRRAIAFAVDRTAIAPIWDATPTDQLLPPVVGGFRDRHLYPLRPDLASARALMHGHRIRAVMVVDRARDSGLVREGQLIQAELAPIGIRVVLKRMDSDAAGRALATGHPRIDLADWGHIAGTPDGPLFVEQSFGAMPSNWLTPAVKRAVERVIRMSGGKRQAAAGALADRLLARDVPLVAIGNRAEGEVFAPTVGCRVFAPTGRGVDLAALCQRP